MARRFRNFFFWTSRLQVLQGVPSKTVSRKHSKIWLRRANIKPYVTPKVDCILKLSTYYRTTRYANFKCFRTTVQMSTSFYGKILKFSTRVLWAPPQPLTFFSFAGNFGSPKTQISPPKKTKNIPGISGENESKPFVNGWVGAHRTRAPIFKVISPKNGVDIGC